MGEEIKPGAGAALEPPQPPAPQPTVEELQKQIKDRDSKIQDLETTNATLATRYNQPPTPPPGAPPAGGQPSGDLKGRTKKILEDALVNPEAAANELTGLLEEVQRGAVTQAQNNFNTTTVLGKLRAGVQSSNPEFDDDIVDVVMQRAEQIAATGKFKTAEEAVNEAAKYVKSKFDAYAQKKSNATPPLPPGAGAEHGAPTPPAAPKPEKVEDPSDVITSRQEQKQKKIL